LTSYFVKSWISHERRNFELGTYDTASSDMELQNPVSQANHSRKN